MGEKFGDRFVVVSTMIAADEVLANVFELVRDEANEPLKPIVKGTRAEFDFTCAVVSLDRAGLSSVLGVEVRVESHRAEAFCRHAVCTADRSDGLHPDRVLGRSAACRSECLEKAFDLGFYRVADRLSARRGGRTGGLLSLKLSCPICARLLHHMSQLMGN